MTIELQEARDVCSQTPQYALPVTFDCSLACTSLGWAFQSGAIVFQFYKTDANCPAFGNIPSKYFIDYPEGFGIGLGCRPDKQEGVWQGRTLVNGVSEYKDGLPYLGITFRFSSVLTVNPNASVNVVTTIERLVPKEEITPMPEYNVYTPCGTITGTFYRDLSGGIDPLDRNTLWTMRTNPLIKSISIGSMSCPFDAMSVQMTVLLYPFELGCTGNAENYPQRKCSLDAGWRTFSCFAALVEPITAGSFKPRWVQLGVNPNFYSLNQEYGCFYGENRILPFQPATLNPSVAGIDPFDFCNVGCPNENNVTGDKQQIQIGITNEEFNADWQYTIMVKSVNKSSPCVAIKEKFGTSWTVCNNPTWKQEIYESTGHYILICEFPTVSGAPRVILYGLGFPTGVIRNCVVGVNPPDVFDPNSGTFGILTKSGTLNVLGYHTGNSNLIVYDPSVIMTYQDTEPAIMHHHMIENKIIEKQELPDLRNNNVLKKYKTKCKYRSELPIRKDNSCGCAGNLQNVYKCDIFGECKLITSSASDPLPICVRCDKWEE